MQPSVIAHEKMRGADYYRKCAQDLFGYAMEGRVSGTPEITDDGTAIKVFQPY